MPSVLPPGDPAPADGLLPESARIGANDRGFSVYIHVPYCRVRCGYCDFNTYTATELGTTSQDSYADEACKEIAFGAGVLAQSGIPNRQVQSVFFGGGTPTLLPAEDLAQMLNAVRDSFGIQDGAEITTEANPDSVDERYLKTLKDAGFTRISFGMQSAMPHVLEVLDRTHNPENVPRVVAIAKELGLHTSVDLIYGAPGESISDWEKSVEAALALAPDHISAYALIVEEGTKLAGQIKRGQVAAPDDDLQAKMYELADLRFKDAGFEWYEISNWAKTPAAKSRHNLAYWVGDDWWGVGPGAHSHVGGVRWWNVKHPAAYAARIADGVSPAHAREIVDADSRRVERILLESRISDGLDLSVLTGAERLGLSDLIANELIDGVAAVKGKLVLTQKGRLLADTVVHALLGRD